MVILEIRELIKDFSGLRAINNISLEIQENEIFGLIGPNGSGKTTLFNIITGFLKPTKGSIFYKGKLISRKEPFEIAKLGVMRTFQLVNLFPNLTVEENVLAGCHLKASDGFLSSIFYNKGFRNNKKELKDKIAMILEFLKLSHLKKNIAKNLSLGDERKLEIAIALAGEPTFLLLDEQWAGMNQKEGAELINCINDIRDKGMTLMIVEHNMRIVMELCDRISVLHYGEKIAEGTPEEICSNKKVISVYLGRGYENVTC